MQPDKLFTIAQVNTDKDNEYILAEHVDGVPMYRRVMTEKELHREAMFGWVETIKQLWDAIGKPVDETRLNVYCKQLSSVPLGLLEAGINYAIRNNTYTTIPPIGLIWQGIRKELTPLNLRPDIDIADAIEEWNKTIERRAVYILAG